MQHKLEHEHKLAYRIESARLILRPLTEADCTPAYLGWLNDPVVNRFLETKHTKQTLESIRAFVAGVNHSPVEHLFGMFLRDGDLHIGNIKVGPVLRYHPRADISLFLGNREAWGQGYATEAILAISRFSFETLGLKKLCSSMYADNLGSYHAFLKAGYRHEGHRRHQGLIDGVLQDILECGCIPADLVHRGKG